ncbi:MAG: HAMP domain-containing protein [Actinomycetia bacterium]|nr:HAMP domain-containing protein [Actinomycetes bacterium]
MRITVAAVLVVGVALLVAAASLVATLRGFLTEEVANAARLRATELAAAVPSGAVAGRLLVDDPEDEFVQVLGSSGEVVASTANITGLPTIVSPAPDDAVVIVGPVGTFPLVAAAAEGGTPQNRFTVVVALSLEPVTEATALVTRLLLVGASVLLALIALISWVLVGRALAPVEAIRREVDGISTAQLHRRVPDPGTDDEVSRLARTMNRMLDRVERGHQRQRQFVSDASHELRTPSRSSASTRRSRSPTPTGRRPPNSPPPCSPRTCGCTG